MAIEFVCPECHSGLRVGDDTAGKVVRCGSCMATVKVPAAAPAPPPDDPDSPPRRPVRKSAEPVAPPGASPGDRPRGRPTRRRPPPPKKGKSALFWVLVVLGIVGLLGAATCAGVVMMVQPKWHTHKSEKGGFAVDLPAPARPNMRELAKLDKPDVEIEGAILPFEAEEYVVVYWDLDAARRQATDDQLLNDVQKGLFTNDRQFKVVKSDPATVSGFPARKLHVRHETDGNAVCLVVIAETRVYVVMGWSNNYGAEDSANVRRFLDSFAVTDPEYRRRAEARKQKEREEEAAETERALEEDRRDLRSAGTRVGSRVYDRAEELRDELLAALEQAREEVRDGGRAAAAVAEKERAAVPVRPPVPVAPPPRPRGEPRP